MYIYLLLLLLLLLLFIYRVSEVEDEVDAVSDTTPVSGLGRIWFSLVYDEAAEKLTVRVIKAKYPKRE